MGTYLTFSQDGVVYALPVSAVESVVEKPPLVKLPDRGAIKGIFSLRGAPVAIGDLREVLGGGVADFDRPGSVIVLNVTGSDGSESFFGAFADAVDEVVELEADVSDDCLFGRTASRALSAVARRGEEFALLLDPVALAREMGLDGAPAGRA